MAKFQIKTSSKVDDNGKSEVIVRITMSRSNRPSVKTGIKVHANRLRGGEIVVPKIGKYNKPEVDEAKTERAKLQAYISRLTAVCKVLPTDASKEAICEAMDVTKGMTVDKITAEAIERLKSQGNRATGDKTFYQLFADFLNKRDIGEYRRKHYVCIVRALARYEKFVKLTEQGQGDWHITADIDKERIEDFIDYVVNERQLSQEYPDIFKNIDYPEEFKPIYKRTRIAGERGHNAMAGWKRALRTFWNWLNDEGYTTNNPLRGMKVGAEVYGTPYYLTLEERNKIADSRISDKRLAVQRDIFIFQCLTGCRVSDLMKLTSDNIKDGVLEYIPKKTSKKKATSVTVPLNDRAARLVAKYKGVDRFGRLFPFIQAQEYNGAIKDILTVCNIRRPVTIINSLTGKEEQRAINEVAGSHMARRTFIGNLYKKVKDPNLIGSMSGHSEGSKAFARYRDIDIDIKRETVALID